MKLPEEVGGYTGLMLLDKGQPTAGEAGSGGWAGYRSWVYKAWKESDGKAYCLRRIEGESVVGPFEAPFWESAPS